MENRLMRMWVAGEPCSSGAMYTRHRGKTGKHKLTPEAQAWEQAIVAATIAWRREHGFRLFCPIETFPEQLAAHLQFVGVRGLTSEYAKLTVYALAEELVVEIWQIRPVTSDIVPAEYDGQSGAWIELYPATNG